MEKLVDEPELDSKSTRGKRVVAVLAGLTVGYIGWLVGVSIGEAITTVSRWSLALLLGSLVLAGGAGLWGWRLRRRQNHPLAVFAFTLPVLPVVFTLGVLVYTYL